MLRKVNFVNLLRKTKQSDIFFIEVLPRYFFEQTTYFWEQKFIKHTNDGQKKIQKYFYVVFNSVL